MKKTMIISLISCCTVFTGIMALLLYLSKIVDAINCMSMYHGHGVTEQ